MTKHRGTSLYRATVELTAMIVNVVRKADRGYRFTIGEEMVKTAFNLTMDFYQAYNESDNTKKLELVKTFIYHLEQLRAWLDVAHALGFFNYKNFPVIVEQCASIERQAGGWLNGIAKVPVTKG
jgi:hypothetical protein